MGIILNFENYRKNNKTCSVPTGRPARSLRAAVGHVQTWESDAEKARVMQAQSERDFWRFGIGASA